MQVFLCFIVLNVCSFCGGQMSRSELYMGQMFKHERIDSQKYRSPLSRYQLSGVSLSRGQLPGVKLSGDEMSFQGKLRKTLVKRRNFGHSGISNRRHFIEDKNTERHFNEHVIKNKAVVNRPHVDIRQNFDQNRIRHSNRTFENVTANKSDNVTTMKSSNVTTSDADPSGQRSGRFFSNLFGILGNRDCLTSLKKGSGNKKDVSGICYNEVFNTGLSMCVQY